jgi:hypothetical protein
VAAQLVASQMVLSCIELVVYYMKKVLLRLFNNAVSVRTL